MAFDLYDRFRAPKYFFELNLKYLFLVGLWPEANLNRNQQFLYRIYQYTLHCLAVIFLIVTGIKTYQIKDEIALFLANIDKSIVAYNYFFKVIFFLMRRKDLKKLLDDIFLSGDEVTEMSRKDMVKHLIVITVFNSGLVFSFSMIGLYNGEMSVEAWMPFDAKKNKINLALSAQILAVLFCVPFSYRAIGMQGIVCSLLIYLCDQLVSLQEAIQNLDYSKENENEAREKLKKIIMKHIRLMRYSTSMEIMFKEYFLIQNLAVTMELCLCAMMVTVLGTEQKTQFAGFLAFLGLALLNAYLYCYLGNELINQSEAMALAAYSSDWTSWPVDMQKHILLIIRATQRPFQMSAGGIAVICMQTYGAKPVNTTDSFHLQALYNGYTIFAVMNDVVDN